MEKQPLFSQSWSEVTSGERNEIVFERRNKSYGAYEIRTTYDQTLLKAFAWTGAFIILFSALLLFGRAIPLPKTEIPETDSTTFRRWEKEKEKTYVEERKHHRSDPKKNESDFPEVKKDTVPEKDTVQWIASANTNNGHSNDTAGTHTTGLIDDGGGKEKNTEIDSTYDGPFIQEPPTYPGGDEALLKFLKKNIVYPEAVKEIGGKGLVGISFVIDKEGNVTEATVAKACKYQELNNEALRVVKKLPKWNTGRQQGKPVKVRMIIPIRFDLKQ